MTQISEQPTIQYACNLSIIHANQSALKLVNLRLEQARGLSLQEFWGEFIDVKAHSSFLSEGMKNLEFRQTPDNLPCKPTLLFDSNGTVIGILIEYTFKEPISSFNHESIFEAIFEHSPYAICLSRFPTNEYLLANEAHKNLTGYSLDELLEKKPLKVDIWADSKHRELEKTFLTAHSVVDYPINIKKKDGTETTILLTNSVIDFQDSNYTLTFSREYSTEFQLQTELRRSESFLRTALDASNDGFFDWSIDGTGPTYANTKLHHVLGYQVGEAEISFQTWLNHIYPEDLQLCIDRTQLILAGQYDEGYDRYRMVKKDSQTPFWVLHHHKVAERDQNGKPSRLIGTITDLTEQMRIETELRQQKELLESVFTSIDEGIWDFHVLEKRLLINPRSSAMLNIDESEVSYINFQNLCVKNIHPDDLAKIQPEFFDLLRGKSNQFHVTCRTKNSDKSWRWIEVLGTNTESTNNGIPIRIVGTVKDVTRDKALENQLLRTQNGVDNAAVMIFLIGPDEKFHYANKLAIEKIGFSIQELKTKTIFDLEPKYPDQSQQQYFYGTDYLSILKNETYFSMESEIMTKTGSIIPVIISASYLEIDNQPYVWAFVKDIQVLKSVEKQLLLEQELLEQHVEEQTQELTSSRNFLEFIINILPFPFYYKDDNLHYTEVNQMFADFFGFSRQELVGKTGYDVTRKDFAENAHRGDLELLQNRNSIIEQSQLSNFEGEVRDVLFIKKAFVDELTGNIGIVGTFIDITDQIQLQSDLETANKELESALKIKDEFIANISHELKTPLTSIIGLSEIMLSGLNGTLKPNQEKHTTQILESGKHLLNLITELLEFSKLSAGATKINKEVTKIRPICVAAVAMMETNAFKKDIEIEFAFDDTLTTANLDPLRMRQILINLLNNAIKFTPKHGKIGLMVNFCEFNDIPTVEFIVWDQGIGIKPEERERIFDLFYQAQSTLSRDYEGSGIGLALVKKFIEEHQGTITVESNLNQGSKFIVHIPIH